MFLLLLHLPQDCLLLYFDETPPLLFAEPKPELFYPLSLLGRTRAPDLVIFWRCILSCAIRGGTWLMGCGGVGRWRRWVVMCMIMRVGM